MSRRSGTTLLELLLAAAFIGCGVVVAISGGERFGVIGYVGGFLLGTVGSFAGFAGFGLTIGFGIGLLTGDPELPECSNGKCRIRPGFDSDYRYGMATLFRYSPVRSGTNPRHALCFVHAAR